MVANADRVVAICGWLLDALKLNGVPAEKLHLTRSGVNSAFAEQAAKVDEDDPALNLFFRLLYLGRWDPAKGLDVLVHAIRALLPEIPITLSIHGIGENAAQREMHSDGLPYHDQFEPPCRSQVMATLLAADALAVPSLWLEMAPMVVLEAKAAGLPIIGSRLGGIAELVNELEDGMLVPPGNVAALAEAIMAMFTGRTQRPRSRPKAGVRTMRDVARDVASLYETLGR